ncbi:hypothetical protein DFH94DRAFT_856352, partial [Russula ochroleuca]
MLLMQTAHRKTRLLSATPTGPAFDIWNVVLFALHAKSRVYLMFFAALCYNS